MAANPQEHTGRPEEPVSQAELRRLALDELDAVHRMAMTLCRDQDEAEELVQETYVKALSALPRFELRDHGIRPWLFRILHNVFYGRLDKARRAPRASEMLDTLIDERFNDAEPAWDLASLDWEQVDERIKQAIDELDPRFREVLLLWSVEGMKYREIAKTLELPIGTIMSRLYRARAFLVRHLSELAKEYRIADSQDGQANV
ncbi:MAG: sigma-70 family RNA polymerase sigma factor [Phycisphaeraceae bacterium]|nr:sigma-70 family RNA polymerase sigma factor [Phycisphaeraceae bacterium]